MFATEEIKRGTFIVEYKGRRLRNKEADRRADLGAKYLYEINSRWTVDGSSRSNVARYANHSCRPNAESDVTREKKIIIRATKRIHPGDEITYDYGRDYFNLIIKKIGCRCAKCHEMPDHKGRTRRLLDAKPRNGKGHNGHAANGHSQKGRAGRSQDRH